MPNLSTFKTPEEYNKWMREYRAKNREKMRGYNREYNRIWRKNNGHENEKKWKKNNIEKVNAQNKLRYHVKVGNLLKKPCAVCDSPNSVAHHFDYTKPLEVIWLCRSHHREIHYGNK